MAEVDGLLSKELSRVLCAPYPVSLKRLDHLLALADGLAVRKWVDRHPCQIQNLASLTADALSLWPYSLRILQCLSCAPDFRNHSIRRHPGLLDALLTKATTSSTDFDQYFTICVQFLSEPLPEALPLPASAQSFFIRVLDKAVKSPSVSTLGPIHSMLNGACRDLLGILPNKTRISFDEQLCRILVSNNAQQDPMLLLWCFGIALLVESPSNIGTSVGSIAESASCASIASQEHSESNWKTPAARKLFGSAKSQMKTLTMTVLSVIWACKGEVGVSNVDAIEGIRIAIKTVEAVDIEIRRGWPTSSAFTKSMFHKVIEKALRNGIHPSVQLEAFAFLAVIAGEEKLPTEVHKMYKTTLENITHLAIDNQHVAQSLVLSLPKYASRINENTAKKILSDLLDASGLQGTPESLELFYVLTVQLTAVVSACRTLRVGFLLALSSNDLQGPIQCFLRTSFEEPLTNHHPGETCSTYISNSRRKLASAVVSLLLTAALTAQEDEVGISASLATALANKQRMFSVVSFQCKHDAAPTQERQPLSIFQESCTPDNQSNGQNWKQRLSSELEQQTGFQRELVIRTVARVCQELEERCETVEEPLRQERRRVEDLQLQVTELSTRTSDLEGQAIDRKILVDGLEAGLAETETHLRQAQAENNELSNSVKDLRRQLEEANKQADRALRVAQDSFNIREIQLRTALLSKEEAVKQQESHIDDLNGKLECLQNDLSSANDEHHHLSIVHESLNAECEELKNELHLERQQNSQKAAEISNLTAKGTELAMNLQSVKRDLDDTTSRLKALETEHEELSCSSKKNLASLKLIHESELQNVSNKAADMEEHLKNDAQQARDAFVELEQIHEASLQDLEIKDATIYDLETEVKQLSDACAHKDEELEELKALKNRVLATMGISADNIVPTQKSSHSRHGNSTLSKTPGRQRQRRSALILPSGPGQHVYEDETEKTPGINRSFDSNASSKSGPTPKRAKPRKPFKVPALQLPQQIAGTRTTKLASGRSSAVKRSALMNVSVGRSNQSPIRRNALCFDNFDQENADGKGLTKKKSGSPDTADISFDGGGMFTSTPEAPDLGLVEAHHLQRPHEIFDETTVDF